MVLSSSVASVSQASFPFPLLLDQAHELDRVKQQYQVHYSESHSYHFPGSTPRHPLLQRLCGMQEVVPQMPFWWADGDAMWRTLTTLIGQAGVALWQPPLYLKRLKGSLCEFDGPRFQATGIPFSSPSPLPYLDQPGLYWKSANGQSSLHGTVVEVLQAT